MIPNKGDHLFLFLSQLFYLFCELQLYVFAQFIENIEVLLSARLTHYILIFSHCFIFNLKYLLHREEPQTSSRAVVFFSLINISHQNTNNAKFPCLCLNFYDVFDTEFIILNIKISLFFFAIQSIVYILTQSF